MRETFGQRLARLRKKKGLTQEEVANKISVDISNIINEENCTYSTICEAKRVNVIVSQNLSGAVTLHDITALYVLIHLLLAILLFVNWAKANNAFAIMYSPPTIYSFFKNKRAKIMKSND